MPVIQGFIAVVLFGVTTACTGSTGSEGPPGAAALDHGTLAGTVKDATGAPVAGAGITTLPPTTSTTTDASGAFNLGSVAIGAYAVLATKEGYVSGELAAVGVAAGAQTQVAVVLAKVAPTTASIAGTVRRKGTTMTLPVGGAQVCVEGARLVGAAIVREMRANGCTLSVTGDPSRLGKEMGCATSDGEYTDRTDMGSSGGSSWIDQEVAEILDCTRPKQRRSPSSSGSRRASGSRR